MKAVQKRYQEHKKPSIESCQDKRPKEEEFDVSDMLNHKYAS